MRQKQRMVSRDRLYLGGHVHGFFVAGWSRMLTAEAFRAWCDRLQLAQDTAARIAAMRASPPVRTVTGRAGNVAGRYPSPKMQHTIQFESQHVELWAIYAMERDEEVLEYYDQPARMPLRYRAASGRPTTQWHTPDFFVLRQGSAGWEEWKPLPALEVLAVRMPARYHQTTAGHWRCPPGEAYAEPLGMTYRVRSSAEYHPVYIKNLKFLQDFWAHDVAVLPEQAALVLVHVEAHPGIRLTDLLAAHPALSLDVVWTLLATRHVFTDLTCTPLLRHDQVVLYGTEAAALQTPAPPVMAPRPQGLPPRRPPPRRRRFGARSSGRVPRRSRPRTAGSVCSSPSRRARRPWPRRGACTGGARPITLQRRSMGAAIWAYWIAWRRAGIGPRVFQRRPGRCSTRMCRRIMRRRTRNVPPRSIGSTSRRVGSTASQPSASGPFIASGRAAPPWRSRRSARDAGPPIACSRLSGRWSRPRRAMVNGRWPSRIWITRNSIWSWSRP